MDRELTADWRLIFLYIHRKLLFILFSLALASCSTARITSLNPPPASDHCRALFSTVDHLVVENGVADREAHVLDHFPFLRVSRFYASFKTSLNNETRYKAWINQLASLDQEARHIELNNLPPDDKARLGEDIESRLDHCRETLMHSEGKMFRKEIIGQARVPNDYHAWYRILGLYPITSLFVSSGVKRLHAETAATYATDLKDLPVTGKLMRWSSVQNSTVKTSDVQHILSHSVDVLGIPRPNQQQLDQLFAAFAPIWEVDVVNLNDKIGSPTKINGQLEIDTDQPAVYHKLSYTRYRGETLLQLNYVIWFPARSSDDIYGGKIDGINWRVTLGSDGTPLMYDVIHNCGCYHKFYPSAALRLRSDLPSRDFEPPLVPQKAPQTTPDNTPVTLRIAHLTHYIENVRHTSNPRKYVSINTYNYDQLRSLPSPTGTISMFDDQGLVPESRRSERFLLWPMGVPSPGAMRQWGKHSTTFVGKRHFDDPDLIESLFEASQP